MKKEIEKVIEKFKNNPEFSKLINKYYHFSEAHNIQSAEEVVPYILKLINPKSVVDVGCGMGSWLSTFNKYGISHYLGIEGEHLNPKKLLIDPERVIIHNLETPIKLDARFDLAVCLEVVEHLSESSADIIVKSLVDASDVILFSAAIPNQGGLNHINEQWVEYWEEKFKLHEYEYYDLLRPVFWNNNNVDWWYRQNMFLIIKKNKFNFTKQSTILNLIHPELFSKKVSELNKRHL